MNYEWCTRVSFLSLVYCLLPNPHAICGRWDCSSLWCFNSSKLVGFHFLPPYMPAFLSDTAYWIVKASEGYFCSVAFFSLVPVRQYWSTFSKNKLKFFTALPLTVMPFITLVFISIILVFGILILSPNMSSAYDSYVTGFIFHVLLWVCL